MKILRWIDRNLWSSSAIAFLIIALAFSIWSAVSRAPVLLAALPTTSRQAFYLSLTGTSGTFFATAVAVVTILVTFAPRATGSARELRAERHQTRVRTIIVGSLLGSSFFLLVTVITATVAQVVDLRRVGNSAITTLIEASAIASAVGLLVSGVGFALVIVERSH